MKKTSSIVLFAGIRIHRTLTLSALICALTALTLAGDAVTEH